MADLKKLIGGAAVIVAVVVAVLIGIAIVNGFSKELRDVTGTVNMTMTTGAVNVSTLIGTTGQYPFVQALTQCENSTGAVLPAANFTWTEGTADGGYLALGDDELDFVSTDMECLGAYLADTAAQGHADNFSTGLAIFGSFIGVLVLAVLGRFIIGMFRKKKE